VQFVSDFENLYGKQHLSFNVHQTLHLVQSVRDWGPLWSHAENLFESYNSVLLNMIKVCLCRLCTHFLTRAIPANVASVERKPTSSKVVFWLSARSLQSMSWCCLVSVLVAKDGCILWKRKLKLIARITLATCFHMSSKTAIACCPLDSSSSRMARQHTVR